ncbi:MAG TPA: phosphoribosyltransferase, partial [Gallicola sp.]|nr:phosphoribosyltransferase [Gallicola sp.]
MKNYIEDIKLLASKINCKYDSIYPIPRGGYLPAIIISQELNIPISFELTKNSLIVDDLIDSGKTLSNYSQDKAVVYVKNEKQNEVNYFAVKAQGWINIPDEQGTGIEENIKRIFQFIGENPDREG